MPRTSSVVPDIAEYNYKLDSKANISKRKKPKYGAVVYPELAMDCHFFKDKIVHYHLSERPRDIDCFYECKANKDSSDFEKCIEKFKEKDGGKRKTKKYRNKTKRKRSYSSKKT